MIAARLALLLLSAPIMRSQPGPSVLQSVEGTPSAVVARLAREALGPRPRVGAIAHGKTGTGEARPVRIAAASAGPIQGLGRPGEIMLYGGVVTLVLCLGGVVAWRASRRGPAVPRRTHAGLYWAARSLMAAGSSRAETAHRTGLAQDALSALEWIERASGTGGGRAW